MGKESHTQAKVQCMRGTDNQNVSPPIVGGYTHWTFWGLLQASGSALFPALYVVCYVLLIHRGARLCFCYDSSRVFAPFDSFLFFFSRICPQDPPPKARPRTSMFPEGI